MSRILSRDTGPEMLVRRRLHAMGRRFRLHRPDLPGSPDIVLPKLRLAVFVHGCFWHQHAGCARASAPRSRQEYWGPKLARNVARDARARAELEALGWRAEVVWECDARSPARLDARLKEVLGQPGRFAS